MLHNINPYKVLFLDIETVPLTENWEELSKEMQQLWTNKTEYKRDQGDVSSKEYYESHAGIWAEFGKVICISVGYITKNDKLRIKSFYGHDERSVLLDFAELLNNHFYTSQSLLCAHNGKEFDFPFLARRMLVLQIELPNLLNLFGKKPWEVPHLDTLELWKFGDYKHYTSLNLLAHIFEIPTPKDDIDGSRVAEVYYKEKNLDRIKTYCEKDVLTVAQVFRKMRYETLLETDSATDEY